MGHAILYLIIGQASRHSFNVLKINILHGYHLTKMSEFERISFKFGHLASIALSAKPEYGSLVVAKATSACLDVPPESGTLCITSPNT